MTSPLRFRQVRRRAGFTLIETLIALFVIVVGILPMITLLYTARRLNQQAQAQTAAYNVARQKLAELAALSYANRPAVTAQSLTIPTAISTEFPAQNMAGEYDVTNRADLGDARHLIQQIAVHVHWVRPESSGKTSSLTLDTLVAKGAG